MCDPSGTVLIVEGWTPGVRVEDRAHAVGLTWAAQMVCSRFGVLTVGGDIWGVAEDILRCLLRVWEMWYFVLLCGCGGNANTNSGGGGVALLGLERWQATPHVCVYTVLEAYTVHRVPVHGFVDER